MEKKMSLADSESEDRHWVETLFPPHFSFLNLVEDKPASDTGKKCGARALWSSSTQHHQGASSRQEIYKATLQRVQEREERQRREELAKRITLSPEKKAELGNEVGCHGDPACSQIQGVTGKLEAGESSRCIWTNQDIDSLRRVFYAEEKDWSRLRSQLSDALIELGVLKEWRRKMQNLLDGKDQQLVKARQVATLQAMHIKALQEEGHRMTAKLQTEAERVKDTMEGKRRLDDRLKKVTNEIQEVRQENSNLSWDISNVKNQLKTELERQKKALKLEHDVALGKLQRELEETKARLKEERESHMRTQTALDLLRMHFNNQSHDRVEKNTMDKITHAWL